uniref:glycosyltransferase family 8 protein n=1 Tax=Lachnospira sp. TaxID=2049031 RepID=UPI004028E4B3
MYKIQELIPIFFTIDDGYAPYLHVALISLIKNASKDRRYKIIVVYQELNEENRNNLAKLVEDYPNFEMEFKFMKQSLDMITDRIENRLRSDYFTMTIYFRIFIPDMYPEYDKAIYIDSDIIVPGDISELYDTDMHDNLIGVVTDGSVNDVPELQRYMTESLGLKLGDYFNSGMLLMNMKELRNVHLAEHFLYLLNKYHFDCVAPDQDYLNSMCYGKIEYLDSCWDAMPNRNKPEIENPKIIHYNLFDKPWCYDDIQYQDYFWEYAKQSVYYDKIKAYKAAYTDKQKEDDHAHLLDLFRRAGTNADTEVTFRKVLESGEKVRL